MAFRSLMHMLTALLLLLSLATGATAAVQVRVMPASTTRAVGSTITVTVEADSVTGLGGFQFGFAYNTTDLQATSVTINPAFDLAVAQDLGAATGSGMIAATVFNNPPLSGTPVTLATMDFKILTPVTGTITLANVILGQVGGTEIPSIASGGTIVGNNPNSLPGAPTAVTATAGNARATVSFTAPANNGSAAIIGYSVTSSPDGHTATGTASPITVTGLTNGTAYTFTVTAMNSAGTGSVSNSSNSVTPAFTSQFFGGDITAAAVMAGTPYNMDDPAWLLSSAPAPYTNDQNRNTFAYKLFSAFFMLGYQTEISYLNSWSTPHLLALHAFQARNALPVTNLVDAACLLLIDQQLSSRELLLAPLAQQFQLYGHMQPLHTNDISKNALAAIYSLPMTVLPQSLRMDTYETAQCIGGQCNGFIQNADGTELQSWPNPIDLSQPYYFVGSYFDRLKSNSRLPSAAVHVDTVLHEYAHYLDGFLPMEKTPLQPHIGVLDTKDFYSIGYDITSGSTPCYLPRSSDPKDWITKYARNSSSGCSVAGQMMAIEDWPETFAMYVTSGRDFRAAAAPANQHPMIAQKYSWLKVNVFNGMEYDTDLPHDLESGCNDVPGTSTAQPGYMHCNDTYVWDFTLPLRQGGTSDTPNPFTFASKTNIDLTTAVQAAFPVIVSGISTAAPITVSGGEYSINGGPFTTAPGWVNNGDSVSVWLTSSAIPSTTTKVVLMIGGVSGSFSVSTKPPLPAISGNPSTGATQGEFYSFAPVATGANSFTISNKPSWAGFDPATGTLSGTPTTIASYKNIVITAFNITGSASLDAFDINISAAHPTISGVPADSVAVNTPYPTFIPTVTYKTGFQTSWTDSPPTSNLPPGLNFSFIDGSISGTPTAPGVYQNLSLTAINAVFTASLPMFSITVLPPQPIIEGTPPANAAVQTTYSFTPAATNFTGFQISDNLPPGLIFNDSTGNLSGKPEVPGTYGNIVITAVNAVKSATATSSAIRTAALPAFSITVTPTTGTFVPVFPMKDARRSHTSTLLPDGRVLVAGGIIGDFDLTTSHVATAELYDPAADRWTDAPAMTYARGEHTSVLLNNGTVLVAGGTGDSDVLNSAEIFDPASTAWNVTGAMSTPRTGHTTSILPDGKVLVAGGVDSTYSPLSSAEIYDPVLKTWTITGSLATPRSYFSAIPVANGKILVAGGFDASYMPLGSAEIYDPVLKTWSATGSLATPRNYFSATLMANGKVLVAGGNDENWATLASAEIYDPNGANGFGSWSDAAPMTMARNLHTATLLSYGTVLVIGGSGSLGNIDGAELYDPVSNTWKPAGSLTTARSYAGATLLTSGKVLVSGGYDGAVDSLASAELYSPEFYSLSYNGNGNTGGTVQTGANAYLSGTQVTVPGNTGTLIKTGYSFAGWNTAANGSGVSYEPGTLFTMGTANVTLYAKWSTNTYTVTFISNGGSTTSSQSVPYNSLATAPATPAKAGNTFAGWYSDETFTTFFDFLSPITANTTLFAKWAINNYTISFFSSGNGTLSGITSQTVNYGAAATQVTAVPATGYHFVNWTEGGTVVGTTATLAISNVTGTHSYTANFAADPVNGVCGSSNGSTFTIAPTANLCGTGSAATTVTGAGPWNWSCSGLNGGSPASCSAAIDITGPALAVSTLATGTITTNATLNVSGTVTDASGIARLTINTTAVTVTNGSFSYPVPLHTGANSITIVATDTLGNSTNDTRIVTLDTTAPELTVSAPVDNSKTAQGVTTISGTINETSTVTATINKGTPQNATITGSTFNATGTLVAGLNTITITATDLAGNSSNAVRSVIYDNTKPSLAITTPSQDITTTQNSITISGTVSDTITTATVSVTFGSHTYTPVITGGAFTQQFTIPAAGTYAITANATDEAGNSSSVTRNVIYSVPVADGVIIPAAGKTAPDIQDALKSLNFAMGVEKPTESEKLHADVAPLVLGVSQPDGELNLGDTIVILRKVVGL